MAYWDTSALAKLYVNEVDSAQFVQHLAATGPITTSALARWELFRVLTRKEAEGVISKGSAEVLFRRFEMDTTVGKIRLIPWDNEIETQFQKAILQLQNLTPPLFARTLDGIHITSAIWSQSAQLVTTDANMRKCATALGLAIFP